ncbi:unnamed protein product [Protopolystoma xenopodis]|uniref:Uncharacterized protein n=1 Tax=Protopolystoma xenopodis TaxID=117903 RepID=A0A448WPF2_9PLAT|nr:unnamed protein product [Protopolystoma xenopodis]
MMPVTVQATADGEISVSAHQIVQVLQRIHSNNGGSITGSLYTRQLPLNNGIDEAKDDSLTFSGGDSARRLPRGQSAGPNPTLLVSNLNLSQPAPRPVSLSSEKPSEVSVEESVASQDQESGGWALVRVVATGSATSTRAPVAEGLIPVRLIGAPTGRRSITSAASVVCATNNGTSVCSQALLIGGTSMPGPESGHHQRRASTGMGVRRWLAGSSGGSGSGGTSTGAGASCSSAKERRAQREQTAAAVAAGSAVIVNGAPKRGSKADFQVKIYLRYYMAFNYELSYPRALREL